MTTVTENETVKNSVKVIVQGLHKQDWLNIFGSINAMNEECVLEFKEDSIQYRGMDPTHVCMVDMVIPDKCFERYEVSKKFIVGLRADEVLKIVKAMQNSTKRNSGDQLRISIDDVSFAKFELTESRTKYDMRLIEVSEGNNKMPKLTLNAKLELDKDLFYKALKNMSVSGDYVRFTAQNSNKLALDTRGDSGEVRQDIQTNNIESIDFDVEQSTYSLEYLLKFLRAIKTETLTLEYSSKMPLRLSMKIADYGQLEYYLAPRIQE